MDEDGLILSIAEQGYGKRTPLIASAGVIPDSDENGENGSNGQGDLPLQ